MRSSGNNVHLEIGLWWRLSGEQMTISHCHQHIPLHGSLLQKLVFLKYVLLPTFNAHNNVNVHDEIIIDSLVLVVASINNQNDVH